MTEGWELGLADLGDLCRPFSDVWKTFQSPESRDQVDQLLIMPVLYFNYNMITKLETYNIEFWREF